MTTIKVDTITNAAGTGAPNIPDGVTIAGTALASINSMDYTASASEPTSPKNGAIWWDTGNEKFFQYMNGAWIEVSYTNLPPSFLGNTAIVFQSTNITTFNIGTLGNASSFGTITNTNNEGGAVSNGTRAVSASPNANMEYVTIATAGNGTSFGTLTLARSYTASISSLTRGLFAGGGVRFGTGYNTIDYITIATAGNATDFGDTISKNFGGAGTSDNSRGVYMTAEGDPGITEASGGPNSIQYVTIDTTGNATAFGALSYGRAYSAACGDTTYAVFGGGQWYAFSGAPQNVLDYVTIQTTGNATDFGDLTVARTNLGGTSSKTRGVFCGGGGDMGGTNSNVIDYITIATPSNATDFGDLSASATAKAVSGN